METNINNKAEQNKYFTENEEEPEKEQCPDCERWVKWLDEENSLCQKCL